MCVIYMKTKCHCDMVMLFPCVNLTNAAIQRAPHPTTRLSVSAQTFDLYLFFVILILSCHHPLPPPSPPPPFMCPNRIGCAHVIFLLFLSNSTIYIMQAQGSIFQATIAIRLVTSKGQRSGSLLKVTARIRITKVTVWQTTMIP